MNIYIWIIVNFNRIISRKHKYCIVTFKTCFQNFKPYLTSRYIVNSSCDRADRDMWSCNRYIFLFIWCTSLYIMLLVTLWLLLNYITEFWLLEVRSQPYISQLFNTIYQRKPYILMLVLIVGQHRYLCMNKRTKWKTHYFR